MGESGWGGEWVGSNLKGMIRPTMYLIQTRLVKSLLKEASWWTVPVKPSFLESHCYRVSYRSGEKESPLLSFQKDTILLPPYTVHLFSPSLTSPVHRPHCCQNCLSKTQLKTYLLSGYRVWSSRTLAVSFFSYNIPFYSSVLLLMKEWHAFLPYSQSVKILFAHPSLA